ncbi:hypothetical protein V495_06166 [Pseudogymnoascus sp. VKM F-4514 (FW-929)]|nr:hypothetical protein V495_06166 [Pseudogymnoascus sp. VKM F-4514 (FW-929)]KFY55719.1 hypothetical protein V497_06783 [Pseudogymnoascus sp. VKM F-4516 (FW-969)]
MPQEHINNDQKISEDATHNEFRQLFELPLKHVVDDEEDNFSPQEVDHIRAAIRAALEFDVSAAVQNISNIRKEVSAIKDEMDNLDKDEAFIRKLVREEMQSTTKKNTTWCQQFEDICAIAFYTYGTILAIYGTIRMINIR